MKRFDKNFLILIAITIVGISLRLAALNQSLWLDEATSIQAATHFSYYGLITQFGPSDFHPPLYYLLLKFWISHFGQTEIAVRLLSVLCGVALIPTVFAITDYLTDRRTGLVASALTAVGPLLIYYSQEARMYALETVLVALSIFLFLRLVGGRDRIRFKPVVLLFTAVNIAVLYTDYLPAFVFLVYFFWLIWQRKTVEHARSIWISLVITALAFVPFLPIFFQQLHLGSVSSQTSWAAVLGVISVKSLALVLVKFLIGRIAFPSKSVYGLYVLINLGLVTTALALTVRMKQSRLLIAWLTIPLTIGIIIGLRLAIFDYFRFLFVLPALYILIAIGIGPFIKKRFGQLLFLFIIGLQIISSGIYLTKPQFQREDWRSAVRFIETHGQQPALTVFVNPSQGDAYDYYSRGIVPYSGREAVIAGDYRTIWLMRYVQDIFDPVDAVRQTIEQHGYMRQAVFDFNRVIVWQYRK